MQGDRRSAVFTHIKLIVDSCLSPARRFGYNLKDVGAKGRKSCLDVDIFFCADFHEAPAFFSRELRAHIIRDHLFWHIYLVPDEHYNDVFVTVIFDLLMPRLECQETVSVADIVDQKSCNGATEKDRCEGLESLLPKRIPYVKLCDVLRAHNRHILPLVLDLLGGLVLFSERALDKSIRDARFTDLFVAD